MAQTTDQLLDEASQLYDQKNYNATIALLPDDVLLQNKNAVLYVWRGIAYGALNQVDASIADYTKAITLDPNYTIAYFNRGLAYYDKKEYDKAIEDYTKAIASDKKYAAAYYNRGLVLYYKQDYDNSISDYTKAIDLDPKYVDAYINRGLSWYYKQDDDKAIADYNQAIALNGQEVNAFYNRGLAWFNKQEYDKAVDDYTTAIGIDRDYAFAYYNRASANTQKGAIMAAINDYEQYIHLANNPDDYWTVVSQSAIKELSKRASDEYYNVVIELVNSIKKLLVFQDDCITHYTGLSAAKAMILSDAGSPFRLSEGSFLNDTSEGRELSAFLNFSGVIEKDDATLAKPFGEKPFIGSFVNDKLSDDLTLWRMYGKEDRTEAKGCSITMNKNNFLAKLKDMVGGNADTNIASSVTNSPNTNSSGATSTSGVNNMQAESQFTFYKVAYITKDPNPVFIIPGSPENEPELNKLLNQFKGELGKLGPQELISVKELVSGIAYLFKSTDYQYEKEVRLVVQGVGFDKKIDTGSIVPRVYIELIDISSVLSRITLGPKVESAEEWAAAFNYQIKKRFKTAAVEIVTSHLPFK